MVDYTKRNAQFVVANKELVDTLLAMNKHNRPMKYSAVNHYMRAMERDQWSATNQGIGVSRTGVLLDGQNRLEAMRRLEYPAIEFLLVTGLDDASQIHVDTHSRRSQSDLVKLALNQKVSSKAVSALNARQLFKVGTSKDRLTADELAEQFAAHGETLTELLSLTKSYGRSAVLAALLDYSLRVGKNKAYELAEQIGNGEFLERDDPAYKIRQALPSISGGAGALLRIYRLMISVCTAHCSRKKLGVLKETENWPSSVSFGLRGQGTRQNELQPSA